MENEFTEELKKWDSLDEIVGEIEEAKAGFETACNELIENSANLKELLEEGLLGLLETLNAELIDKQNSIEEQVNELVDRVSGFESVFEETKNILAEFIPDSIEEITSSLNEKLEATKDLVTEEMLQQLEQLTNESLESTKENIDDSIQTLREEVDDLVDDTKEQANELFDELTGFGKEWTESIEEIQREYDRIVHQVSSIGDEVKILMELMDDGLSTSGVGMNAAASILADVKSILEDVI